MAHVVEAYFEQLFDFCRVPDGHDVEGVALVFEESFFQLYVELGIGPPKGKRIK